MGCEAFPYLEMFPYLEILRNFHTWIYLLYISLRTLYANVLVYTIQVESCKHAPLSKILTLYKFIL